MCLDKITKVYKPSLLNLWIPKFAYKSGVGWKVFKVCANGDIYGEAQEQGTLRPLNKWLNARNIEILISNRKFYTSGFHVILKEKDLVNWSVYGTIMKVKYRNGHVIGKQFNNDIIVADKILILPEGWKPNIFQRLWDWLIKKL